MSARAGDSFEEFLLSCLARNPALISETSQSIAIGSSLGTLTDSHRRILANSNAAPPSLSSTNVGNVAQHSESLDAMALFQRGLLDPPLLPLGGEHLLYENIWSAFTSAANAAISVYNANSIGHSQQKVGETNEIRVAEEVKRAEEKLHAAREKLCQAFEKVKRLVEAMEGCAGANTTELCKVRSLEKYFTEFYSSGRDSDAPNS